MLKRDLFRMGPNIAWYTVLDDLAIAHAMSGVHTCVRRCTLFILSTDKLSRKIAAAHDLAGRQKNLRAHHSISHTIPHLVSRRMMLSCDCISMYQSESRRFPLAFLSSQIALSCQVVGLKSSTWSERFKWPKWENRQVEPRRWLHTAGTFLHVSLVELFFAKALQIGDRVCAGIRPSSSGPKLV